MASEVATGLWVTILGLIILTATLVLTLPSVEYALDTKYKKSVVIRLQEKWFYRTYTVVLRLSDGIRVTKNFSSELDMTMVVGDTL